MKKTLTLFSSLLFLSLALHAQNLVPNPSFEDTVACPSAPDELDKALGWSSYSYSPDYMNDCSISAAVSVPYNWGGYQQAASGNAYAAFATYASFFPTDYREFIGGSLSAPLDIGEKYYVSFKICLSIFPSATGNCASDKMGAMFSTIPYSISNPAPITNGPQMFSNSIITDTINWTRIFGSFIADSAYSYIIIGNFFNDINTDTLIMDGDSLCHVSYYFLDDVCVSTDSIYAATYTGVGEINNQLRFSIYPNPTENFINIDFPSLQASYHIYMYDVLGQEIFQQKIKTSHVKIDISHITKGILLIKVIYNNQSFYYKLIKQ